MCNAKIKYVNTKINFIINIYIFFIYMIQYMNCADLY